MDKYAPLRRRLAELDGSRITWTLAEIETILADRLPYSARTYEAWWSNEERGGHVQARAWMEAGWKVIDVDLGRESVTLVRML